VVICLSVGCLWLTTRNHSRREPSYSGKPASYWARQSRRAVLDDSVRVLRQMGSVAVPYLTNQLTLKDGPLQNSWLWIWPRLPTAVRARIPQPVKASDLRLPQRGICFNLDALPKTQCRRLLLRLKTTISLFAWTPLATGRQRHDTRQKAERHRRRRRSCRGDQDQAQGRDRRLEQDDRPAQGRREGKEGDPQGGRNGPRHLALAAKSGPVKRRPGSPSGSPAGRIQSRRLRNERNVETILQGGGLRGILGR